MFDNWESRGTGTGTCHANREETIGFTDPEPRQRLAQPRKTAAKLAGLTVICAASVFVGGFVLPGGREAVAPVPGVPKTNSAPPPTAAIVKAVAPAAPAPVVKAPTPVKRTAHPLDAAPVVVPQLPAGPAYELAATIDREIDTALAAAKVPPSPPADDAEFLRRVSLDLTGTVPTYGAPLPS